MEQTTEQTPNTPEAPKKTFAELGAEVGLDPDLLLGLADMGYTHPTPVQEAAIPAVAAGKDLMAQARTGTGKTLAFGLPTLHKLNRTSPDTQVLVIAPTRELAVQVADELGRVAKHLQIIVAVVFGGVKVWDQVDEMQWAPVVVGTPGRLRDMIERGYLHLDTCKVVVLDEADEMLDMGFKDDLEFILAKCPKDKQTLLFSATFPPEITRIAHKYMREPEKIEVSSGYTAATNLQHKFARVPKDKKIQALATLLRQPEVTNSIVFCETKTECAWVFQRLKREGFNIGIITGDIPQEKRLATLQAFRDGEITIIVATDVAARGLDIPLVSHVFHFTVPRETATYVHRSGRTARAGRSGIAFTLVTPEEDRDFQRIMRDIKQVQPGAGAPAPRPERGPREERGGREDRGVREPREERGPREPREERGGREGRGDRERNGRERQSIPGNGREERAPREERGPREDRGGRERFDRNEGRAPQRNFAPTGNVPAGLGEAITTLGGRHIDNYLDVAQTLLGQVDAARLVAALLSQNPRAISLLEAAQAPVKVASRGPREEGDREPRGERGDRGGRGRGDRPERVGDRESDRARSSGRGGRRDRYDPDRGPRFEPEPEGERRTNVVPGTPQPALYRESRPAAPRREAAPVSEAPADNEYATVRTRRSTRKPVETAPAVVETPAAVAPEAEAKPTRTRKVATKAAVEPVAAPVSGGASEAEAKAKPATRTRKAATPKAEAAVEAPVEEKPKAKRATATKTAAPKATATKATADKEPAAKATKATTTKAAATKAAKEPAAKAPAKATTSRAKKATT